MSKSSRARPCATGWLRCRADDFKDPLADLDTLLTHRRAGRRDRRYVSRISRSACVAKWNIQRTVRLSDEDAIQLITAHKAKGLEWDAVIVPFLGRRISEPRRVIRRSFASRAAMKCSRRCTRKIAKRKSRKPTNILRRQEMERLLYVALTRARHTLVLALDRGLFSPKTIAPPITRS